jgi:hypothetical protein
MLNKQKTIKCDILRVLNAVDIIVVMVANVFVKVLVFFSKTKLLINQNVIWV